MKKRLLTTLFLTFGAMYSNAQMPCDAAFQANLTNCPDVTFIDASVPGGGPTGPATVVSWDWDFGDGNTSTSPSPTNVYTTNGAYYVCLTIMTDAACTSTYCDSVTIPCIPAGIDDFDAQVLTISPNPTFDNVNINLLEANDIYFNIIGTDGVTYEKGTSPVSEKHTIDISDLSEGVYYIVLTVNGNKSVKRFIKQ
jgi:PKD repeat protein